jgi:hypothetical protein
LQPEEFQGVWTVIGVKNLHLTAHRMLGGIKYTVDTVVGPVLPVFGTGFATGAPVIVTRVRVKLRVKSFFVVVLSEAAKSDKQTDKNKYGSLHKWQVFKGER